MVSSPKLAITRRLYHYHGIRAIGIPPVLSENPSPRLMRGVRIAVRALARNLHARHAPRPQHPGKRLREQRISIVDQVRRTAEKPVDRIPAKPHETARRSTCASSTRR